MPFIAFIPVTSSRHPVDWRSCSLVFFSFPRNQRYQRAPYLLTGVKCSPKRMKQTAAAPFQISCDWCDIYTRLRRQRRGT